MMTTLADYIMGEMPQQPTSILANSMVSPNNNIYADNWNTSPRNSAFSDFSRNFNQGYNENYNNRFNVENLAPNENKNWQTRLGEGLGTVGRFLDSPLGRGLITAGLVGATGGSGLQALAFGANAGIGRQQAQTADRVYRKQLGQMGYSQEDLDNITGNITPSIYKGLTDSFRLGNQRMTYGQLAMFDDDVAEMLRQSPELVNQFVPMQFARDIYGKRKDKAQADIENTQAKTEKTKAETGQVGKPRVTINRREGGTTSRVIMEHKGGSGKGGKTTSSSSNKTVRPLGQNLKEGTVIKNKQGQRMVLRGGKWQPM